MNGFRQLLATLAILTGAAAPLAADSTSQLPDIRLNRMDVERVEAPPARKPIDLSYLKPTFDTKAFERNVLERLWTSSGATETQLDSIAAATPYAISSPLAASIESLVARTDLEAQVFATHPKTQAVLTSLTVDAIASAINHHHLPDLTSVASVAAEDHIARFSSLFESISLDSWYAHIDLDFSLLARPLESILRIGAHHFDLEQFLPILLGNGLLIPEPSTYLLLGSFCLAGLLLARRPRIAA